MNKKAVGWKEIGVIIIVLLLLLIGFIVLGYISDIGLGIVGLAPDFDESSAQGLLLLLSTLKK